MTTRDPQYHVLQLHLLDLERSVHEHRAGHGTMRATLRRIRSTLRAA